MVTIKMIHDAMHAMRFLMVTIVEIHMLILGICFSFVRELHFLYNSSYYLTVITLLVLML